MYVTMKVLAFSFPIPRMVLCLYSLYEHGLGHDTQ